WGGDHLDSERVPRVGKRALAELDSEPLPAAVPREREEEADRATDVQQPILAAKRLELVQDLAKLLAVELELALRREHVDPEVVGAARAVLLEHEALVDLRVREDEPT